MHTIPNPDDSEWRKQRMQTLWLVADLVYDSAPRPALPTPTALSMRAYVDPKIYAVHIGFATVDHLAAWAVAQRSDGYEFSAIEHEGSTWHSTLSGLEPVWYGWHQVELYCLQPEAAVLVPDAVAPESPNDGEPS